jgi:hypothetical protein
VLVVSGCGCSSFTPGVMLGLAMASTSLAILWASVGTTTCSADFLFLKNGPCSLENSASSSESSWARKPPTVRKTPFPGTSLSGSLWFSILFRFGGVCIAGDEVGGNAIGEEMKGMFAKGGDDRGEKVSGNGFVVVNVGRSGEPNNVSDKQ